MATNTYILFPRHAQPCEGEIFTLEQCQPAVGLPRYGINKRSGGLAIEFGAAAFQAARRGCFDFDALVSAWEKQGCSVSDECPFAPNLLALQPKPDPPLLSGRDDLPDPIKTRAREAVAMARLETARVADGIKQGGETVRQVVPYLVVSLVLGCVLYAGYATYQAATDIDIETRRETIKRVSKKPMKEKLTPNKRTQE